MVRTSRFQRENKSSILLQVTKLYVMTIEDLHFPRRVWINNPSKFQPHNKLHGKVGIAVYNPKSERVSIHFTEGKISSMEISINHIELKHS